MLLYYYNCVFCNMGWYNSFRHVYYQESWAPNNWCFWTVVLEKALVTPLDYWEIQPVNPKGNHSWIFIRRTDAEAEVPILWPPDAKYWLIGKDSDAGRDCKWEEKGTTEDEMIGWHHWLDGHEYVQALRVGDSQGSLVSCSPWVAKSWAWLSSLTELKWNELEVPEYIFPIKTQFSAKAFPLGTC